LFLTFVFSTHNNNAESRQSCTSVEQEASTKPAADNKTTKYQELETTRNFFPVAIETTGSFYQAIELVQVIRKRIIDITEDNRETTFLF